MEKFLNLLDKGAHYAKLAQYIFETLGNAIRNYPGNNPVAKKASSSANEKPADQPHPGK